MTTIDLPAGEAGNQVPDLDGDGFVGPPGSTFDPLPDPQVLRFEYTDPNLLVDNPRNLRSAVGDVEDLKASMAVVGILCPLVVVPTEPDHTGTATGLQIVIGHRRKYAAIALGMPVVPVVVAPDTDAATVIVAQLAENGDRVDLTRSEQAEGFHQLTLLDWTPEKIAKARNTSTVQVKQTLTLLALPEPARQAADAGALTLDDAAVMAEFTDQPAVMGRILKSAGSGWGFRHAIATERSKQAYQAAKDRVKAELVLAGVKITPKPKGWGYGGDCTAVEANRLVDADGVPLVAADVRTRPGFAAFIDKVGDSARAVVYCADPDEWGYTRRALNPAHGASRQDAAERERAEQEKQALRQALTVASGVRADFYRHTYTPTRAVKRLFPDALRDAVTNKGGFFTDVDDLYAGLGGVDGDALAAAKEDLLRRCLVAKWIVRQERNLRQANDGWPCYLDEPAALAWLDQLVADGYTLSDAETRLRTDLVSATTDDDEDEDEEDADADDDLTGDLDPDDGSDSHAGDDEPSAEVIDLPTAVDGLESQAA